MDKEQNPGPNSNHSGANPPETSRKNISDSIEIADYCLLKGKKFEALMSAGTRECG